MAERDMFSRAMRWRVLLCTASVAGYVLSEPGSARSRLRVDSSADSSADGGPSLSQLTSFAALEKEKAKFADPDAPLMVVKARPRGVARARARAVLCVSSE